ncbi:MULTISPECIES: hypothetical protein [unclassified Pseudoclavibacter]|uniref:hypothetical protein n=1 Tax=unclassified Pseudoclavibacter TaxID=2615177 RepID=UPI00130113DF|nr:MULTISPECIES: hypothetical protein [unclassified Pseudoclavibacter]KAB1647083.1 hypothetical protein F8O06_00395 [Pseudoclavibacter sp. CFCC 14310]KAB1662945.1 hypothetical protein F8O08_10365 [Pseudoclavibacter sp. CFCC 13611]
MTRRAKPLPDVLPNVFSVSQALACGVSPWRLRGADLYTPFRGVRAQGEAAELMHWQLPQHPNQHPSALSVQRQHELIRTLAHAYSYLLTPDQCFSHSTAALLFGLPLPRLSHHDIHLATTHPGRRPRVKGVRGHLLTPGTQRIVREWMPLVNVADTWASLADSLGLFDLVAAADAAVRIDRRPWPVRRTLQRPPLTTLTELRHAVDRYHRAGAHTLRRALTHVREDSWSRPESWVRLILVQAGLPEPALNKDLFDDTGAWIACVDGAYERFRVCYEYEGGHHFADRKRFLRDAERREQLQAAGWIVIVLTADHVFNRPALAIARLRSALTQRGMRL